MQDDDVIKFQESLEKKLGKDQMALIADDMGTLITQNASVQETMRSQTAQITDLKNRNEQLIAANGNLFKQISVSNTDKDEPGSRFDKSGEPEPKPIRLKDVFDEKGNFKD